jgi:hypothetical protein
LECGGLAAAFTAPPAPKTTPRNLNAYPSTHSHPSGAPLFVSNRVTSPAAACRGAALLRPSLPSRKTSASRCIASSLRISASSASLHPGPRRVRYLSPLLLQPFDSSTRTKTFLSRGPSNSQKKIPCQVPNTNFPPSTKITWLAPTITALACESVFPSACR